MILRRRSIKWVAALVVVGVCVGWPVRAHFRAKARLAAYKQRLKAAGEKMTVADAAPTPSLEAIQAGQDLLLASTYLVPVSWSNLPPTMRYLGGGKAIVCWQQPVLGEGNSTNIWPGLRAEMARNTEALENVRLVLHAPAIEYNLDYRQGAMLLLPHLARLKGIAQQLMAAAILDLHEGRVTNAMDNLLALTALARVPRDEPIMISELVRVAVAAIADGATWAALQSNDCSEPQLQLLQTAWQNLDFYTQAEGALSMERITAEQYVQQARQSASVARSLFAAGSSPNSALAELAELGKGVLENPHEGLRALLNRYPGLWIWRYWGSYDDELAAAEVTQAGIECVRQARAHEPLALALKGFVNKCARVHPDSGMLLVFGSTNVVQHYLQRIEWMEIQRALTVTAIALKRFQLRHGAYPAALSELVPEYVVQVPTDPIDGRPLRYRLRGDGAYLLYSVGEDGEDNNGDPAAPPDTPKQQWVRGRDAVWPMPASAEEIRAYESKLKFLPLK